jgi:hypothetical protein
MQKPEVDIFKTGGVVLTGGQTDGHTSTNSEFSAYGKNGLKKVTNHMHTPGFRLV